MQIYYLSRKKLSCR